MSRTTDKYLEEKYNNHEHIEFDSECEECREAIKKITKYLASLEK